MKTWLYFMVCLLNFCIMVEGVQAGKEEDARKCLSLREQDSTPYDNGKNINISVQGRNNQEGYCAGRKLVVSWTQSGVYGNYSSTTSGVRGAFTHLCSVQKNLSSNTRLSSLTINSVKFE